MAVAAKVIGAQGVYSQNQNVWWRPSGLLGLPAGGCPQESEHRHNEQDTTQTVRTPCRLCPPSWSKIMHSL